MLYLLIKITHDFFSGENGSFFHKDSFGNKDSKYAEIYNKRKGDSMYHELSLTSVQGLTVSFKTYQNLDVLACLIDCWGFYAVLARSQSCYCGLKYAVNEIFSKVM